MPPIDRRRQARLAACQAAYLLDANSGAGLGEALADVKVAAGGKGNAKPDPLLLEFFIDAHARYCLEAERRLEAVMNTPLSGAAPLERAMLRMAALEMLWRPGTPAAVVINEWLEVSRQLGSEESHAYLNAILEKLRASTVWRTDERKIVERFFPCEAGDGLLIGIGDDAAVIATDAGSMAISADTLVAGVHFDEDCDPHLLGRKALAVNLSDLAAMAARPEWATLALVLPKIDEDWLREFSAGWRQMAAEHRLRLIGGDISAGSDLTISVTVGGTPVAEVLRIDSAQVGDDLWVSGTLGEAACDFRSCGGLGSDVHSRLLNPQPRVQLGISLAGLASAATDLSDGLLPDLRLLADRSGVGASVVWPQLPIAARLADDDDSDSQLQLAACWGDDYELLFCAAADKRRQIEKLSEEIGVKLSIIGTITDDKSTQISDSQGQQMSLPAAAGYRHLDAGALAAPFARVRRQAGKAGLKVAVAESCTAGMLAAQLAASPGASEFFVGGVVAYSPQAKQQLLGVSAEALAADGPVSEAVARQMAAGVAERTGADAAVAITCWAGPNAGDGQQPGTVWLAAVCADACIARSLALAGGRQRVRQQAAAAAALLLAETIGSAIG